MPNHPRQDSTYHDLVRPVVEHWLEREIAQWVHPMKDQSDDPSHHERTLLLTTEMTRVKLIIIERMTDKTLYVAIYSHDVL